MTPAEITPQMARLMSEADRKALGVVLPEQARAQETAKVERELQKLVDLELSRRGIESLHLSPRAREKKGWPDCTLALNGRAIGIELKTKTGQLSPDQKLLHDRLRAPPNNWTIYVCRSFAEVVKILNDAR